MFILKLLSSAIVAFALTACASSKLKVDMNNPQAVSEAITIEYDNFKKVTKYVGPDAADNVYEELFLRAEKPEVGGVVQYQVYAMTITRGGVRSYDSAYDSNGNKLDMVIVSRDLHLCGPMYCNYQERLVLNVSESYLESNKNFGMNFKLIGKNGEAILFLPSGYIKAFLETVK